MNEVRSPEDWGEAYAELEPIYEAFVERLDQLLMQLLEDEGLGYSHTLTRTMDVSALVDRVVWQARRGTPVHDVFSEIGDLAVVDVATYSRDESEPICELIEREFSVDASRSLTFAACEAMNADPARDRVGETADAYAYPRFVISLTEPRGSLPEWRAFDSLQTQIRVLTTFQDAWADIERYHLPYGLDSSYPAGALDAIRRVASHLQAADDALVHFARTTDDAETEYGHAVAQDKLDLELDVPSLTVYQAQSETVERLVAYGERAGMRHVEEEPYGTEAQLWLLRRNGLTTIRDLDDFLRDGDERALEIYERILELVAREDDLVPWAQPESLVEWLVLVLNRADDETVRLTRYRESIESALNTIIGNTSA